MATFGDLHRDAIAGTIGTRLIFKGHLNALFPPGAFKRYLDRRDILLKDAGAFFESRDGAPESPRQGVGRRQRPSVRLPERRPYPRHGHLQGVSGLPRMTGGPGLRVLDPGARSPWPATGKPNGWRWCAVRANACISTGT